MVPFFEYFLSSPLSIYIVLNKKKRLKTKRSFFMLYIYIYIYHFLCVSKLLKIKNGSVFSVFLFNTIYIYIY